MNDTGFAECVVKKPVSPMAGVVKLVLILTMVAFFILGMLNVLFLAVALAAFFAYLLWLPNFYLEYEYSFLQDTLTIDKIINKAKRRRGMVIEMNSVEVIAPAESDEIRRFSGNPHYKSVFFDSREPGADVYGVAVNKNGEGTLVYIEPDEALLKALRYNYPNKVKKA